MININNPCSPSMLYLRNSQDSIAGVRKIPVPANRYGPLEKNWMRIYQPITEHMHLQIRMNLKTKNVEIKVSTVMTVDPKLRLS